MLRYHLQAVAFPGVVPPSDSPTGRGSLTLWGVGFRFPVLENPTPSCGHPTHECYATPMPAAIAERVLALWSTDHAVPSERTRTPFRRNRPIEGTPVRWLTKKIP